MKKNTEAEQIRKEMAALSDEELGAVAGGFDTFPDQDGVDRHSWFVTLMMNHCRNNRITEYFVREYFIRPLGCHSFNEARDLTALLMSYFKEKNIANCILVD